MRTERKKKTGRPSWKESQCLWSVGRGKEKKNHYAGTGQKGGELGALEKAHTWEEARIFSTIAPYKTGRKEKSKGGEVDIRKKTSQ